MRSPEPRRFCHVVEHETHHGYFEGDVCPKCEDYIEPARKRDPLKDDYRKRLARDGHSFHPALEDWHPCFNGGLVAICILEPNQHGATMIFVCGADDTLMERDCVSYDEARQIVLRLPCVISKDDLAERGFRYG